MPGTGPLTVTDQFCGAGGSSQGATRAGQRLGLGNGLHVHLALNHWKLAIETHSTNYPDTLHDCTDIQACDPRYYPTTDILLTSPECTNHSVAKGKKQVKAQLDAFDKGEQDAAAERSRATMWDVVRFAEYHKYKIIITENVVDARGWILYDAWIKSMHVLGYRHECVFLNSMFCLSAHGPSAPQSRDRMYVVFWKKGNRKPNLDIRPVAPCLKCGQVEAIQRFKPGSNAKAKYGRQYTYACPSCGKDVMPFYFAAINAIDWTLPAERIGDRDTPLKERTLQRIKFGLEKYGNRPLSVSMLDGQPRTHLSNRVKDATTSPLFTQHSTGGGAIASPFIMHNSFGGMHEHRSRPADAPLFAQTGNAIQAVVSPPTPAPFLVETKYSHSGDNRSKGGDDPLPAQTGQQSMGVALPFIMDTSFTKANGKYMSGGDEPIGAQTTTQSKAVVIPPAILASTSYFDANVRSADEAMPAQTGANKLGVISPFMISQRGTSDGHVKAAANGLDEAVGTISAGGNHHALITGEAFAFLASYYGQPTMGGIDDAMGTLRTKEAHALLSGHSGGVDINDLYFRMLKPHEVQAGMAFAPDYIVLGNGREKVKQLGNAVTPPATELLLERCIQSLM